MRRLGVEIAEVAVEVDVVLVRAAQMRKAVGIDGVIQQHGDRPARNGREDGLVLQQQHLAARAAESLDAVHGRRQHEQRRRVRGAEQRHVDRELLALRSPGARIDEPLDREPPRLRGAAELLACLGVGRGKAGGYVDRQAPPATVPGIACSASAAR